MDKIRLVVVDDSPTDIFILMEILKRNPIFKFIQVYTNGVDLLKQLDELPPFDILLIDLHLPKMDGKEVIQKLNERNINFKIYAITYGYYYGIVSSLRGLGVQAFSRKDPEVLENLLPKVMNHETIYEDQLTNTWVLNGVVTNMFNFEKKIWMKLLNAQEIEVLDGVANYLTLEQIMDQTNYNREGVLKYYNRTLKALKFRSIHQLREWAINNEFGDPNPKPRPQESFWKEFTDWIKDPF